jgi:outer membrane protein assembly factor BamB
LVEGIPGDDSTAIAIAADGTAYFGDGTGLHARAPDGTARWTFTAPQGGCLASPAIADDGTIYVGCGSNGLALTADGNTKWSIDLGALITETPAVAADGTVYFGRAGGQLHAITPAGVQRWSTTMGDFGLQSSPAIGPSGTLYAIVWRSDAHSLAAIRPTGALAWTAQLDSSIEAHAPVVADDETIYVSGIDVLIAFAADGTKKWSSAVHTNGAPAIGPDGTIYVSGNGFGANVHALNPDGTEKWKATTTEESGNTSPIIGADGVVYILDQKVHAFRADGVLLGERETGSLAIGPASIAGNTVYFADVHGTMHAMHVR